MGEFQLPEDGSVLIIDDNIDEAMPLIKLLSKKGIASIYLSGSDAELPEKPLTKIRLAFIDIQLTGPTDPESHAQTIMRILDTVIPDNNGPYIVIIWTVTSQTNVEVLKEKLESADNGPVEIIQLRKSFYIRTVADDGQYDDLIAQIDDVLGTRFEPDDLDAIKTLARNIVNPRYKKELVADALVKITDELREKLERYDSFHLFTFWENLVHGASGKIVESFSTLYPTDEYWQDNFKSVIYRMAHAQLGKTVGLVDEDEVIRNALKTLNHSFLDVLENEICEIEGFSGIISINKNNISFTKKINDREYKIEWRAMSGRYRLYIDGTRLPYGNPRETKNKSGIAPWGTTPEEKGIIQGLVNEYISIEPEINTRLLIDFPTSKSIQPGNVYQKNGIPLERKRDILKSYYQSSAPILGKDASGNYGVADAEISRFIFIELEITPLCDYFQGNWIKSRLLPGVLIPEKYTNTINVQSESIYSQIPLIIINNTSYKPVFNFHLLKSVDIEKDPNKLDKPIFRAKRELCADILSRLSSHTSRVGIIKVE